MPFSLQEQIQHLLGYNRFFYNVQRQRSARSAQAVVGLVNDRIKPRSVVDVGCGVGAWLGEWRRQGVTDVLGIDGDWVDRDMLLIPEEDFRSHDLTTPLQLARSFDLVMSLEVAEHIDAEHASAFVDLLTSLGSVVMFSAAIPDQGGAHHVNERWQGEWARDFGERGYVAVDCVRPQIWEDQSVQVWYRQNTVLYVAETALAENETLQALSGKWSGTVLSTVHPDLYSTMFLRGASAQVRPFRGIGARNLVRALRESQDS